MKPFQLQQRCEFYGQAFPWPPPRADQEESVWVDGDRWISGVWILGNDYRGSGYYGAYPPNFIKRVMALFPDAQRILHLFSGSLPPGPYTRFDIQGPNADVIGDAHELHERFAAESFDLIVADPPYSNEDADHYGVPMIQRNRVLAECAIILEAGGFLVWLDQVLPMFLKNTLRLCGTIGIVRSTNHRVRLASIFKKLSS
jgi:hypothetical protein